MEFGLNRTDSGLHLRTERDKLYHLREFNRLSGRDELVRCYNFWEKFNEDYFNGILDTPQIEIGITAYGNCSGLYTYGKNVITLHQGMGNNQGILQHEMGHQWQGQIGRQLFELKGHDDSHWCQAWIAYCKLTLLKDGENVEPLYKKQTRRMIDSRTSKKCWNWFDINGEKQGLTVMGRDADLFEASRFESPLLTGKPIW